MKRTRSGSGRGCGCMVLVLGVLNIFILITLLWGIVQNPENIGISVLMMGVFVANVAVCFMMGVPALRSAGRGFPGMPEAQEAEGMAESDTEGEDEEPRE